MQQFDIFLDLVCSFGGDSSCCSIQLIPAVCGLVLPRLSIVDEFKFLDYSYNIELCCISSSIINNCNLHYDRKKYRLLHL